MDTVFCVLIKDNSCGLVLGNGDLSFGGLAVVGGGLRVNIGLYIGGREALTCKGDGIVSIGLSGDLSQSGSACRRFKIGGIENIAGSFGGASYTDTKAKIPANFFMINPLYRFSPNFPVFKYIKKPLPVHLPKRL